MKLSLLGKPMKEPGNMGGGGKTGVSIAAGNFFIVRGFISLLSAGKFSAMLRTLTSSRNTGANRHGSPIFFQRRNEKEGRNRVDKDGHLQ